MRLLLVEDEEQLRLSLKADLIKAGYSVDATDSGREGLFLGSEYPMDVARH